MSTKKRVIVVDDKDSDRWYLRRLAIRSGCEVVGEGTDGEEGLKLAQDLQPNLILTDYVMRVSGSTIARKTEIPIIIVSSDMNKGTEETLRDIGNHVIPLHKNNGEAIIAAIRQALGIEET